VDAFALMTSDSDFTPLVMRILESGFPVFGFGAMKTPQAFVDACSPFIYTENLVPEKADKAESAGSTPSAGRKSKAELRKDGALVKLLRTAVEQTSEDDGWAHMSKVANYISNNSSFSSINYGYRKFSDLIKASELFKVEMRKDGSAMYIKDARG
jgi:uncharacterized LabA/DUF88 family protein